MKELLKDISNTFNNPKILKLMLIGLCVKFIFFSGVILFRQLEKSKELNETKNQYVQIYNKYQHTKKIIDSIKLEMVHKDILIDSLIIKMDHSDNRLDSLIKENYKPFHWDSLTNETKDFYLDSVYNLYKN